MSPTQYRPIIIIKINYKSKILGAVYIIETVLIVFKIKN
jgi:hypothetical protein